VAAILRYLTEIGSANNVGQRIYSFRQYRTCYDRGSSTYVYCTTIWAINERFIWKW